MRNIVYHHLRFMSIKSGHDLSDLLEVRFLILKDAIEQANYVMYHIPKKSGGKRLISEPAAKLKDIQQRLKVALNAVYINIHPECVHGFVSKSSREASYHIKSNASQHVGKSIVWNIDIADFFDSINTTQVRNMFQSAPYNFSKDLATMLALLVCYNRKLPAGAPTSPVVSNLYCVPMDHQLMELAKQHQLTYTRYADDITFSSNAPINDALKLQVTNIIASFGFTLNDRKNREYTQFGAQWVTGVKVNEKPNVSRLTIRKLRAVLHHMRNGGVEAAAYKYMKLSHELELSEKTITYFKNHIHGILTHIGFVRGSEDTLYLKLRAQLGAVLNEK
jgi:RNA-directed DNA polymerase